MKLSVGDATQPGDLGIDPRPLIDGIAATHLEVQTLGSLEINRLNEAMIEWTQHLYAPRTQAITHLEHLFEGVHVQGDMLHGSAPNVAARAVGMTYAELDLFCIVGMLHKRDIAVGRQFYEPVVGAFDTMHPVERLQREAKRVTPEHELTFHIGC